MRMASTTAYPEHSLPSASRLSPGHRQSLEGGESRDADRTIGSGLATIWWNSSSNMNGFEDFQGQPGKYQVVAVDLAGNRSAALSVDVAIDCTIPDGGPVTVDVAPLPDTPGTTVDVNVPRGDAIGQPWDGLYPLADAIGQPSDGLSP